MKRHLIIKATDNHSLSAILCEPKSTAKGSILLCTGLGIPKEFYEKYLVFLGEQGYTALLFDYRGINPKDTSTSNDSSINLRNWGLKDMVGATYWLHEHYPKQKIYLFGHSIGGQVAGLMENHALIERFFFFCSTTGFPSIFHFPLNMFSWFMFYLHIPITARLFGYMPPSLTYRGVRIAKGVALEWADWSRQKKYIAAFFGKTISKNYYQDIQQSIDWIYFKDDPIASKKAIRSMMDYYKHAAIQSHLLAPNNLGLPRIGHSGFFTSKAKKLWRFPLELIEEQKVPD